MIPGCTNVGFTPIAQRKVGDHTDLDFNGSYCRFAIVIIGKPQKLSFSITPYIEFIRNGLINKGVDTLYLLARSENKVQIDNICKEFFDKYTQYKAINNIRPLQYHDRCESISQYLVVLRRKGADLITPSNI